MEREKQPKHEFDSLIAVFSILLLIFVFFLALRNDTSPFIILYAFAPTIAYMILNYALLYEMKQKRFLVWIMPLALVLLFHGFAEIAGQSFVGGMDMNVVSYMNLLVSYIFAAIIMFHIYVRDELHSDHKKIAYLEKKVTTIETEEDAIKRDLRSMNIRTTIQSIEDKCKAINFAIGRVYSDKHGGSPETRNKIKIDKEWYNKFSDLTEEFTPKNKEMVRLSVGLVLKRIEIIHMKEKDIFGEHKQFKNIQRNKQGNDKIIDVLIANDKDPVQTYVKSAKAFCEHVMSILHEDTTKKK